MSATLQDPVTVAHELKPYRQGVIAVILNEPSGQVLVGRRYGTDSWQFPQGGIDEGECPEQTLFRESMEEIGTDSLEVIRRAERTTKYEITMSRYRGQQHTWFLCRLTDPIDRGPSVERATDQEFDAVDWVTPAWALNNVNPKKREAYRDGLGQLGLL